MKWLFVLVAFAGLLAPVAAAEPEALRGVALVIGQSKYTRLPKLANPELDARAIDHMLDDFGFEVTRVNDLRGDKLQERLTGFANDSIGADVAIVYYAGHGVEIAGKNYILATDANISTPEKAAQSLMPLDDLLDDLQKTVPITIVLLDACRTSPFKAGTKIKLSGMEEAEVIGATGLAVVVRGPSPVVAAAQNPDTMGTVVGFAASPGQAALDGPKGKNSPYAAALLKHLTAPGYSFGDVMNLVSWEVWETTGQKQLPWTSSSLNRILYFGGETAAEDTDAAAIAGERRSLLLKISGNSEARRAQIEELSGEYDMDYALVAAVADQIDSGDDTLTGDTTDRLRNALDQINAVLNDPLLKNKPKDTQLADAGTLAEQALAEGAIGQTFEFRKRQAQRADDLIREFAGQQKKLTALSKDLAVAYASLGDAALINSDLQLAGSGYRSAAEQTDRFDKKLSFKLRLKSARAFTRLALDKGDLEAGETAIELYRDLLEDVNQKKQAEQWADIKLQLAQLYNNAGWRNHDDGRKREAYDTVREALTVHTRKKYFWQWLQGMRIEADVMDGLGFGDRGLSIRHELIEGTPKNKYPREWAENNLQLGDFMRWQGNFNDKPARSLEATGYYEAALTVIDRANYNQEWLRAKVGLGEARYRVAFLKIDVAGITSAVAELDGLVSSVRRVGVGNNPWLYRDLGRLLMAGGMRLNDTDVVSRGVALFKTAAEVGLDLESAPFDFADAQGSLGEGLFFLGKATKDVELLTEAREAFSNAVEGYEKLADSIRTFNTKSRIKQADDLIQRLAT